LKTLKTLNKFYSQLKEFTTHKTNTMVSTFNYTTNNCNQMVCTRTLIMSLCLLKLGQILLCGSADPKDYWNYFRHFAVFSGIIRPMTRSFSKIFPLMGGPYKTLWLWWRSKLQYGCQSQLCNMIGWTSEPQNYLKGHLAGIFLYKIYLFFCWSEVKD